MSKDSKQIVKNWKQFLCESYDTNPYTYDNPKFIELLNKVIEPSSFICTFVASAIKMLEVEKIKIYGFSTSENPESKYFVEENDEDSDEGHHFAVMNNRYIIDPWIFDNYNDYPNTFNRCVFDLQNKEDERIIRYLYGDRNKWTDITNNVKPFEQLFPKTYKDLLKWNKIKINQT